MKIKHNNSYKVIKQKLYCCVPACISMVLERKGFKYGEQEEIGYEFGLTVPLEKAHLFRKVRVSETPPPSGYGTQIQKEEFSLNRFFITNNYPLRFTFHPIYKREEFEHFVEQRIKEDYDIIVCFSYGKLYDTDYFGGHVSILEKIINDEVTLIESEKDDPDKRVSKINKLIEAMEYHGVKNSGGIWLIAGI